MQRNRIIYINGVGVPAIKNFKQFVAASRWRWCFRGGTTGRLPQQSNRRNHSRDSRGLRREPRVVKLKRLLGGVSEPIHDSCVLVKRPYLNLFPTRLRFRLRGRLFAQLGSSAVFEETVRERKL